MFNCYIKCFRPLNTELVTPDPHSNIEDQTYYWLDIVTETSYNSYYIKKYRYKKRDNSNTHPSVFDHSPETLSTGWISRLPQAGSSHHYVRNYPTEYYLLTSHPAVTIYQYWSTLMGYPSFKDSFLFLIPLDLIIFYPIYVEFTQLGSKFDQSGY